MDQALRQFEALKPIFVQLRLANEQLHVSRDGLRLALVLADSSAHLTRRELGNEQRLRLNAEQHWQKYQGQSTRRGWTIAGLTTILLLSIFYSAH